MTTPPMWERAAKMRELDIYEREIATKEREVAVKEAELKKSRWSSPVVIALLVGAFGLFGNAGVAYLNNRNTQQVEHMRSQSNLVLEAIRTGSPEKACTNLLTFMNLGLVADDPANTIHHNCQTSPATGPSLPIGGSYSSEYPLGGLGGGAFYWGNPSASLSLSINGIQGFVIDATSHQPIGTAIVSADDLEKVVTDASGHFRLQVSGIGSRPTYIVKAEKEGYQSGEISFTTSAEWALLTIELHKK